MGVNFGISISDFSKDIGVMMVREVPFFLSVELLTPFQTDEYENHNNSKNCRPISILIKGYMKGKNARPHILHKN